MGYKTDVFQYLSLCNLSLSSKNISISHCIFEIDINYIIQEGGVYVSSFLLIIISVLFSLFWTFQFLDSCITKNYQA